MAICPKCQFANPDGAGVCAGCGQPRFDPGPGLTAALTPPLLPAPMVEPILTSAATPPDARPLPSPPVLTLSGRGAGSADTARPAAAGSVVITPSNPGVPARVEFSPVPAPVTLRDRVPGATVAAVPVATPSPGPLGRASGAVPRPDGSGDTLSPSGKTPSDSTPPVPPPPAVRPKLVVLRGQRLNVEYPIYEGRNTIGRFIDKPVDIDLISQESEVQVWCSRTHAAVTFDRGVILIEDLNSLNGTWVNGARIHPGQPRMLKPNDVIQVGTVQMKLIVEPVTSPG
jgi:hypothetical protein